MYPKMSGEGIGLVLLNWNGAEWTLPCLDSVYQSSIVPEVIVIVDNASADNSIEIISREFPSVHIICNKANLGFAGGCNVGMRYLMKRNIQAIWILNNDTEVVPLCLENLLNEFQTSNDVAAVTGKILYPLPDNRIWYAGAIFHRWRMMVKHRGEMAPDLGQYDSASDVPFISGCCMLIRKGALEDIGLFDERFFAYAEDFDWCLRALKRGYRLRYTPKALLYHKVSASVVKHREKMVGGTSSPLAIYLIHRNRMLMIRGHATNVFQKTIALMDLGMWVICYAMVLTLLGRKEKMRALLCAVRDGFMGRSENLTEVLFQRFPMLLDSQ